eukprot:517986-Pyramimonas_sp.AAC.1
MSKSFERPLRACRREHSLDPPQHLATYPANLHQVARSIGEHRHEVRQCKRDACMCALDGMRI